jgi:hypothetical protein
MARLRLLLALFLIAVGTTCGALALSGYYGPHMPHGQPTAAPAGKAAASAETAPPIKPRFRKAPAAVGHASAAGPARPKAAKAPPKKKPIAKAKPPPPPQRTAAQWPWSLFGN